MPYNVIRVYELEGETLLDAKAVGLLPFTALMKPPRDLPSQAWVEKCIETTQAADVDRRDAGNPLIRAFAFREFSTST